MMHKQLSGGIESLIVAAMLCAAMSVSAQSTVTLNVSGASYTIGKALYGALMENFDRCIYKGVYVGTTSSIPNTNGMRNDVIAAFKDAGLGCIEWPGGCFADRYDWRQGITFPQSSRTGGEMSNGMGTPEYFQLCSLVDAIPYITMGVQNFSAPYNALWQNYIDTNSQHPDWKNTIKFWKIGNEEWPPCGSMTQSSYQSTFDQYYSAESATWRERCLHIMDGGGGGGWIDDDCKYMAEKSTATGLMGISYHLYAVTDWGTKGPSSDFTVAQYYNQLKAAWIMDNAVSVYEVVMALSDPNYNVGLCVDEWGAWYDGISDQVGNFNWSTVRDAVIVGMNLNIFNNHCRRVKMALSAQPVNTIQALALTDINDQSKMRLTPAWYVYKMFKPHQGATMVPTTVVTGISPQDSIPLINASASMAADNTLHISMVNIHDSAPQTVTVNLNNPPAGVTYLSSGLSGQIVNGQSITSGITSFTATDTVTLSAFTGFALSGTTITVTMPAHSVVMLTAAPNLMAAGAGAAKAAGLFSITAAAGGTIVVFRASVKKTPIRMALFGIDGREIAAAFNGTLEAGQKKLVWRPRNITGAGVCVVKLVAGEVLKTQRIMLSGQSARKI